MPFRTELGRIAVRTKLTAISLITVVKAPCKDYVNGLGFVRVGWGSELWGSRAKLASQAVRSRSSHMVGMELRICQHREVAIPSTVVP